MFMKLSPTSTEAENIPLYVSKNSSPLYRKWQLYCELILIKHGFSMGKIPREV